jgi:WD40-like Beta Propeller Repeat
MVKLKQWLALIAILAGVAATASLAPIRAAKPVGGGGSSVPAGTIYFGSTGHLNSMNADGSGKTALPDGVWGEPSQLLHGGKRWFLRSLAIPGEFYPNGTQRLETFALPDDGGAPIQLTDDPTLQQLFGTRWAPAETADGALTAGFARRWNADGTIDPESVGLYIAWLVFDVDGVPMGLDAPPAFLISFDEGGGAYDGAQDWDFSPDCAELVVAHDNPPGLRIITVATGESRTVYSGNTFSPAWSPDGTRIAFNLYSSHLLYGAIATIAPDGSGYKTVVKGTYTKTNWYVYLAAWSPDSAFLLYTRQNGFSYIDDVYRIGATGGSPVNLTADLTDSASAAAWR